MAPQQPKHRRLGQEVERRADWCRLSLEIKAVNCLFSKEKANQWHKLDEHFQSQLVGLKRALTLWCIQVLSGKKRGNGKALSIYDISR